MQDLDEGTPVRLVGAEGERLLELVHDDDRTRTGGRLAARPGGDGGTDGVRGGGNTGFPLVLVLHG